MFPFAIALAGPGRPRLGAEELLELGQAAAPSIAPSVAAQAPRTVALSKDEAQLVVKVVENIVSFSKDFPIEFQSYCPPDRWQKALTEVGTWTHEIERQIAAGAEQVAVPAGAVFRLVDLEKCISAARDARLASAKWAFGLAAAGSIANFAFGISWLGVPTYIAGLAILFGRPLLAKYQAEPQEPYKPAISGSCRGRWSLGGGCPAPFESDLERSRPKLLERVILPREKGLKTFYWGSVSCLPGPREGSICLKKGRFRVRVEGWTGDRVVPAEGWSVSDLCEDALNVVGVWDTSAGLRTTPHGPLWERSRHKETFWVEYIGPNTSGRIRRAGPFGCPDDTMSHALEDGAIARRGVDGDFVLFDGNGNPVEMEHGAAA